MATTRRREGSAAIMNAELLARPGAELAMGAGPPARVEITVPRGASGQLAHMYFCFGCDESRALTGAANLTSGCLFAHHRYEAGRRPSKLPWHPSWHLHWHQRSCHHLLPLL